MIPRRPRQLALLRSHNQRHRNQDRSKPPRTSHKINHFSGKDTSDLEAIRRARIVVVKTIPLPKVENQERTADPHYPAAVERVKAAVRELQKKGIIDARGRRIRKDFPPDMREGEDRDFGG